ncbi:MAG TPA: ribosome recycling factor [Candidatus Scatomorpha merdipullorum]|uniref:Ribosome-recycling factor n=1 Tax=Candidatus Scatomorpha merdipullorum TaxID=2840927 RepID=A0A9D1JW06_9FIRM|nr:ribosome recycling factor [Candidatus Scatomorpha merdipullorum]
MATGYEEFETKMRKTSENLSTNLAAVRAGRANAAVLDQITVDYYGTATPIQQLATISTPDPRSLLIQPWDNSTLKGIEKAILASDLGINPQNDGRAIRLVFPQLTEERRKELAKQVKKYAEEAKVAVRNIRRDAMDKFKAQKKASEITEDDMKIAEKDLQKLTDDWIKEIDKIADKKEKELFEI